MRPCHASFQVQGSDWSELLGMRRGKHCLESMLAQGMHCSAAARGRWEGRSCNRRGAVHVQSRQGVMARLRHASFPVQG